MDFSHGLAQWDFDAPKAIIIEPVAYPRTLITSKWFLQDSSETTPALQITKLLHIINHLYSVKEYDQCLDYIQKGLDLNYSKKNEFLEIKARVLKRLNRLDDALSICDGIKRNDPSITYLKGQLHFALGNYGLAFNCFIGYLQIRTDDYSAWKEMAGIASQISKYSNQVNGISGKDWKILGNVMTSIADRLFNRPNSCSGELYELSVRKSKSNSNDLEKLEKVDSTISLLHGELEQLGEIMRKSCLQLGIIEVG